MVESSEWTTEVKKIENFRVFPDKCRKRVFGSSSNLEWPYFNKVKLRLNNDFIVSFTLKLSDKTNCDARKQ